MSPVCRFCSSPAHHQFDGFSYCCQHYQELVDHGAILKLSVLGSVVQHVTAAQIEHLAKALPKDQAAEFLDGAKRQ